jgi:hypothetical protein
MSMTLGDRVVDTEIETLIQLTEKPLTEKHVPLKECVPVHEIERRVNHILLLDVQERRKQQVGFTKGIQKIEWSAAKIIGVWMFLALTGGAGAKVLTKLWEASQTVWAAIAKS